MSPLSPARAAGLRAGDAIVRFNGRQVASREEFYRELWQSPMDPYDATMEPQRIIPYDRQRDLRRPKPQW